MATSIVNIHPDILDSMFKFSLPTSLPKPISSHAEAATFFSSTSPYNLALTCRNWREFALSSHSLWSSIFFSFDLPSSEDSIASRRALERHVKRSEKAPLTCFIKLSSWYKWSDVFGIISCLLECQKRWRRVGLYLGPREAALESNISLMIEDLKLLKELHIHNEVQHYFYTTSADIRLPSLTHLKLEVRTSDGVLNWLRLAPNLQELYFHNTPLMGGSQSDRTKSLAHPNPSGAIFLPALRCLRTGVFIPNTTHDASSPSLAVNIFVNTTCHALTELQVNLHSIKCDEALLSFLRRSAPPLRTLIIDVQNCILPLEPNVHRERVLVDAITLVPSVRSISFEWNVDSYFPEVVFQALSQTNSVLPALEHLELAFIDAPVEQFLDVITARWRSERRTLKAVTLTGCIFQVPYPRIHLCRECIRFQQFNCGDNPSELPESLNALREYISGGLDYRANYLRQNTTADLA
ncbi:hypothetical protein SCHPADRAFT_942268 [Schizopora paradoxa]|uniref:F-box domain-containing protein n=1 Tax=Schizopora paradoxa TaxID=27342 RepID=A0A0H2RH80_9AGAM|nr:hypothetical protein SCHPADRAFT_942268 [Schizopora paradoxa]